MTAFGKAMRSDRRAPYLVVGAGLSGLSAALMLAERGLEVEVWEQDGCPGGLLAPVRFRGIEVDRGSHRVHRDAHDIFLRFTDSESWHERPRMGKLVMAQRHVPYPPGFVGFMRGIGLKATSEMALGFLLRRHALTGFLNWDEHRRRSQQVDEGFERFVIDRVGKSAYEKFYRPYVEKVWGESPSALSRSVAKQRMSASKPLRSLFGDTRKARGMRRSYFYPKDGMSSIVRQLHRKLRLSGVDIRFERTASMAAIASSPFRNIIFSGQMTSLIPESGLRHRGLYLVYLSMPQDATADGETFYLPESRYWFGRVSRPECFSERLRKAGETLLCIEIPEGAWGSSFDFVAHLEEIVSQLRHAGIVIDGVAPLDAHQVYLPHVYPLYHRGWQAIWRQGLDEIRRADKRIFPVGRQGLYLHCNMDHCVSISIDAVDHITRGGSVNDWIDHVAAYRQLCVRD